MAEAVAGPSTGTELRRIPLVETSWEEWREQHPNTKVLSPLTGYVADYFSDPYQINEKKVLGIVIGKASKAFPLHELGKLESFPLVAKVGRHRVKVFFDPQTETAWVTDEMGIPIPSYVTFAYAWEMFYPDSKVFHAGQDN